MNRHHTHKEDSGNRPSFLGSKYGIALAMVGVVGLFYFLREHWSHIGGNWIYLLVLMCPLMHLLGCGRHGRHTHGPSDRSGDNAKRLMDPVSGTLVDPDKALNSTYKGQAYYFASRENRDKFESAPEQYLAGMTGQQQKPSHHRHGCC